MCETSALAAIVYLEKQRVYIYRKAKSSRRGGIQQAEV